MRIFPTFLATLLCAGPTTVALAGADSAAAARALADEYWAAYVQRYPEIATYQGVTAAPHDRLTDNSLAAVAAWRLREDAWLRRVRELVPRLEPGSEVAIVASILDEALGASIATRVCRSELWSLSDTWPGWQGFLADWTAAQPVGNATARQAALARWRALPRFVDTEIANLKEGLRQGYSAPRTTARAVLNQVEALIATPEADSPLLEPARRDGDAAFAAALAAVVHDEIAPALARFREFLSRVYLPAAREAVGVAALPDRGPHGTGDRFTPAPEPDRGLGAEPPPFGGVSPHGTSAGLRPALEPDGQRCYAASVRAHTTRELPARTIHELGLSEMAKLEAEMKGIAERSFGTADVAALLERLRTDPAYTYRSKQELAAHLEAALARARAAMPRWFGLLPKADVKLEPQPAFREPTSDQYNGASEDGSRPGVYLYSTWEPTKKSRSGPVSTAFHETIPGHHLQGAIALERAQAHPLQRFGVYDAGLRYNGAYGEGWGLYAERLADEMGLFADDLDRLGMLSALAYRAARLVVDPGLHVLGWSRERAITYLMAHTTAARSEAESEIDRYIAWPGQATGYYLGYLEIVKLRAEAERRLGARFDVRAFHDRVLEDGALPMPALAAKLERWMAAAAATGPEPYAQVDRLFEDFRLDAHLPGLVWGVVADGRLVHVRGTGVQDLESQRPVTPDSLFRIASMTKAFTALTVLKLRDDGRLRLDAMAEEYVPELRGWRYPTTDSPRLRVRDLLHHAGGLVTDDPWGDRQTPLPEEEFSALLAKGVPFSRAPGLGYEYSNLGYALLGRIIGNVSQRPWAETVERTLLRPLAMEASGFVATAAPAERRALGYRWEENEWRPEPTLGHGAFGAMGGLQTSAIDYAKWVSFLLSAWPARDGAETGPVRRATVRELVQGANFPGLSRRFARDAADGCLQARTYGMGFLVKVDCDLGLTLSHGGGYPGFGSHVLLLPERGMGLFAFANRTYAGPSAPVWEAAVALLRAGRLGSERELPVSVALAEAYGAAAAVFAAGDVGVARERLAMNLLLDRSAELRARDLATLKAEVGTCDTSAPLSATGALAGGFTWRCERGRVRGRLLLAPTDPVAIQTLTFDAVRP